MSFAQMRVTVPEHSNFQLNTRGRARPRCSSCHREPDVDKGLGRISKLFRGFNQGCGLCHVRDQEDFYRLAVVSLPAPAPGRLSNDCVQHKRTVLLERPVPRMPVDQVSDGLRDRGASAITGDVAKAAERLLFLTNVMPDHVGHGPAVGVGIAGLLVQCVEWAHRQVLEPLLHPRLEGEVGVAATVAQAGRADVPGKARPQLEVEGGEALEVLPVHVSSLSCRHGSFRGIPRRKDYYSLTWVFCPGRTAREESNPALDRKKLKHKKPPNLGRLLICKSKMVRERGVEPPRLAALAPQTSVSTIPPLARVVTGQL